MNNLIDQNILSIYIVFGLLIIIGYFKMINRKNSNLLWNNNHKNIILKYHSLTTLYKIMIFFSFIAGIYLVYYLTTIHKNETVQILLYTGSVLFLVYSLVWAYFPFSKYIWISLLMVAIGCILILSGISLKVADTSSPDAKDIIALVSIVILVIQSGFFDFWIWNGFKPFNNYKNTSTF